MTNSNFLKKLLAATSIFIVSSSASVSFINLRQIDAPAAITNVSGLGIADNAPAGSVFNNGESLSYLENNTLNTVGVLTNLHY